MSRSDPAEIVRLNTHYRRARGRLRDELERDLAALKARDEQGLLGRLARRIIAWGKEPADGPFVAIVGMLLVAVMLLALAAVH